MMIQAHTKKFALCYLLFLLIAGFCIREHLADLYDYGPDQVMSMQMAAGESLKEVWAFSTNETHPPVGHFIRHFWMQHGTDIEWQRLLSYLSDTLLIVVFFLLGNRLYPYAGLAAASFAAFSPAFISLSRVIRNYSFFSLFLACSLYGYFRFLEKKEPKWLLFYSLCAALSIGTHFGAIIPVFAIGLATLPLLYKERKQCCLWLIIHAVLALLFLFLFSCQDFHIYQHYFVKPPHTLATFLYKTLHTLAALIEYPAYIIARFPDNDIQAEIIPCLFLLSLVAIEQTRKTQPLLFRITLIAFLVWSILCISSFYDPIYRRNIWVAPFIILPFSIGLTMLYNNIRLLSSSIKLPLLASCMAVIAACAWVKSDSYNFDSELVKKSDTVLMQHYIANHIPSYDVVVGGRASMITLYFYVVGENYYRQLNALNPDSKDIAIKTHSMGGVSFISTPFYYTINEPTLFIDFFKQAEAKGWLDRAQSIWFYSIANGNESVAEHLLACPSLKPFIHHKFITPNRTILLFSLPKTVVKALITPEGRYYKCLF